MGWKRRNNEKLYRLIMFTVLFYAKKNIHEPWSNTVEEKKKTNNPFCFQNTFSKKRRDLVQCAGVNSVLARQTERERETTGKVSDHVT